MRRPRSAGWAAIAACLLVSILLVACGSTPPTRFYLLSPTSGSAPVLPLPSTDSGISVGVGPIRIPDYLDRPQIITRSAANTLELAELDRWAEPLASSIPRILAENLSTLLGTHNVALYPWPPSTQVDVQVLIELIRFEGRKGDRVVLEARWTLLIDDGRRVYLRTSSTITESVEGETFEALVSAQSRALTVWSREIASAITSALVEPKSTT